jgi:hypothetical protein
MVQHYILYPQNPQRVIQHDDRDEGNNQHDDDDSDHDSYGHDHVNTNDDDINSMLTERLIQ